MPHTDCFFLVLILRHHYDNQKRIIDLVMSLTEDGSNIRGQLGDFKNKISIADDEKNMLFRDIDELLIHWHNYAKTTDNKSLHQFKNAMALCMKFILRIELYSQCQIKYLHQGRFKFQGSWCHFVVMGNTGSL
jgi:hypothetical protein